MGVRPSYKAPGVGGRPSYKAPGVGGWEALI